MRNHDIQDLTWCMFFGGLCSFLAHPGHSKLTGEDRQKVLDFYASVADDMYGRYWNRHVRSNFDV